MDDYNMKCMYQWTYLNVLSIQIEIEMAQQQQKEADQYLEGRFALNVKTKNQLFCL